MLTHKTHALYFTTIFSLLIWLSGCTPWSAIYTEGKINHDIKNVESIKPSSGKGHLASGSRWNMNLPVVGSSWSAKVGETGTINEAKKYTNGALSLKIRPTSDGNMIGVGTFAVNETEKDALVVKFDASGNILWQNRYGGKKGDSFTDVLEIKGEGYLVAGYTSSFGANNGEEYGVLPSDIWIVRLDNTGNIDWEKRYDFPGWLQYASLTAIAAIEDNRFIVTGVNNYIGWIMEIDDSGTVFFKKNYIALSRLISGYGVFRSNSILPSKEGGYILGLMIKEPAYFFDEGSIMKVDKNGNIEWITAYYTDDLYYSIGEIIQKEDGNYIAIGSTDFFPDGLLNFNAWLAEVKDGGNVEWEQSYDPYHGPGRTHGYFVDKQVDNFFFWEEPRLVLGGYSRKDGSSIQNLFVSKVGEKGELSTKCGLLKTPSVIATQPRPLVVAEDGSAVAINTSADVVKTNIKTKSLELKENICMESVEETSKSIRKPDKVTAFSFPRYIEPCLLKNTPGGNANRNMSECILNCPLCSLSSESTIKQYPEALKELHSHASQLSRSRNDNELKHFKDKILDALNSKNASELINSTNRNTIVKKLSRPLIISDVGSATRKLNKAINEADISLKSPKIPSTVMVNAGNKISKNLSGISRLEFDAVKTGGKINLKIKSGMPASVSGFKAGWPIITYRFDSDKVFDNDQNIRIGLYFGGISFSGDISHLRLLEWNGSGYKDITTKVDFKEGYIYGITHNLSEYVIVGSLETSLNN